MEGLYRARAKSYWLSPSRGTGGWRRPRAGPSEPRISPEPRGGNSRRRRARLGERTGEGRDRALARPLAPDRARRTLPRARDFWMSSKETLQGLAKKYGADDKAAGEAFQSSLVCYPRRSKETRRRGAFALMKGDRNESTNRNRNRTAAPPSNVFEALTKASELERMVRGKGVRLRRRKAASISGGSTRRETRIGTAAAIALRRSSRGSESPSPGNCETRKPTSTSSSRIRPAGPSEAH